MPLLGSLGFLSAEEWQCTVSKGREELGSTCFLAGRPRPGPACAGEGLGRQGIISRTSSPAGWDLPTLAPWDEWFVFSQTMSCGGKGSSSSSLPSVFTRYRMLSSRQTKSPHMLAASKRTSPALSLEGRKAHVPDSTPATHLLGWVCTHSETGYIQHRPQHQKTKVESLSSRADTYSLLDQLPYIINY